MNDTEFNDLADQTFGLIEDAVDTLDMDLDFDQAEGVLTIECPDTSLLILSRQVANQEIWIAARSGGYHLALVDESWVCSKTGESLGLLLSRLLTEQTAREVSFQVNHRLFGAA